jgi:hypothetical protein
MSAVILAIDPGPEQSAWIVTTGDKIVDFGKSPNLDVVQFCNDWNGVTRVVIEKVESFGMPVGREVFETVFWSGRFAQAAFPTLTDRIGRKAVKIHLCGSMRAKDSNIRAALIDRYGGSAAIGRKANPGPLYGISGDVWSALAVAVTWADQHAERGVA